MQRALVDDGRSEGTAASTKFGDVNLSRARSSAFNKSGVFTQKAQRRSMNATVSARKSTASSSARLGY